MEHGLSSADALKLLKQYGKNVITTKKPISPLRIFLEQFPTFLNGILFLAACFSLFTGDIFDSIFIVAILLLNGIVGFLQEYNAERSLEKLTEYVKPLSRVIRDGKQAQIPTSELVPGDVVSISEGDSIPADGVLLHHEDIEVDESILTGESLPVAKEQNATVFGGTLIIKGKGHMTVEKTGIETRFGQIALSLATVTPDNTPLRKRLDSLSKIVSVIAIMAAACIVPLGILQKDALFPLIILAISVMISAIPQSLPTVVTIALALGTQRMAKKHAIVRKMHAVETLGSTQILLVDKTGTLTENAMRVKSYYLTDTSHLLSLLRAAVFGNTASLIQKGAGKGVEIVGDKTDGALLLWAKHMGKSIEEIKNGGDVVDEFVFDPQEKTITNVWKDHHKTYVFVRGAPEAIIEKSRLSEKEKNHITKQYETFASQGLRVIGFGMKHEQHPEVKRDHLETHLTFLGFVGIYDPPREEAKQAVHKAKQAGITTIMVTGDNEKTALAIAKEIGLIEESEDVVTGDELINITDVQLSEIIDHTRVFARSKPEDKLRLVNILKQKGYIVAVTGDGVNDALALKRSDVGVSMGQSGTDVAKEASDIVLMDDNFSTLVAAVEQGRIIYHNIVKAITYLLTGTISETTLILLATLFGLSTPLLPTQILWINLITDGLPALALASDITDADLIKDKPRDPNSPILTRERLIFINVTGIGLGVCLLSVYVFLSHTFSPLLTRTIMFNLTTLTHVSLAFIVRGKAFFKPNSLLIWFMIGIILLQLLITITPSLQQIFHIGLY